MSYSTIKPAGMSALVAGVIGFSAACAVAGLAIPWSSVSSGAGTLSSGNWRLTGTLGRSDAGNLAGGGFTFKGGFQAGAAPVPPSCPQDVNGDHVINTFDLAVFLHHFGELSPAGSSAAIVDFNHDGIVNTLDLATFLRHFGESCP